jgi:hypothetical protein
MAGLPRRRASGRSSRRWQISTPNVRCDVCMTLPKALPGVLLEREWMHASSKTLPLVCRSIECLPPFTPADRSVPRSGGAVRGAAAGGGRLRGGAAEGV